MIGYGSGLGLGLGGFVMMIGGIILVVGLVALVAWAVARATPDDHGRRGPEQPEALDILRARFARGEISEADYTQAANVLKADR